MKMWILKACLEGRKRGAVVERERERTADFVQIEAEGTNTILFSFKSGMRNDLSSEEERRDLEWTSIWTSSFEY